MKVMPYRRKKEGRTNYRKRLALLKSGLPRLVIRASNTGVQAQAVAYSPDGDSVLATVRSHELVSKGWKGSTGNIPAAYLTGILLAQKLKGKLSDDLIVDIGLQKHHSGGRLYAVAKGAIDGGLNVRIGEDVLPSEERINGAHINDSLSKQIEEIKKKIMS